MCDEKPDNSNPISENPEVKRKKQIIRIQEVENGYTVSSNYSNEFVAMNLEEAITLVRNALE